MRIAHVINSLDGYGAGAPIPAITNIMREAGAEVRLFALSRRDGKMAPVLEAANLSYETSNAGKTNHLQAADWLRQRLRVYRPTLLWTSLTQATVVGQLLSPALGTPVVSWQHNVFLKPANLAMLRLTQRQTDLWVADSHSVAEAHPRTRGRSGTFLCEIGKSRYRRPPPVFIECTANHIREGFMGFKTKLRHGVALGLLMSGSAFAQAAAADLASTIPTIIVRGTPLPTQGLDPKTVAAPVQYVTDADIARSHALNLTQFMTQRMGSVQVNDTQNNPFQPDINFRGYTASPLLGTPEGLSVYMDGVRLNQPFGDVVSWDLFPLSALRSITLMPGSNPLFGLNTLGGALSLETKTGLTNPGSSVSAYYGSFDRTSVTAGNGGAVGAFDWFVTGTYFKDDGWRDLSPSTVRQVFGKLGWHNDSTDLHLSTAFAENELTGNGLQEQRFLERRYSSVYTSPDQTKNRSKYVNLEAKHALSDTVLISGNAYYRHIHTHTYNGDINDDSLDQSVYQPGAAEQTALRNAGYTGFPTAGANAANTPFPKWRCIANALIRDEPGEKCNGVINQTTTGQSNYGVSGQVSFSGTLGTLHNELVVGGAFDGSHIDFLQGSELGYLTPDRTVIGVGAFGDGVTGGDVDGEPYDTRVNLTGKVRTASVFASDTIALANDTLHVTASARYNHSTLENVDHIIPAGAAGTLTSDNTFQRLNPAVGVTYAPLSTLTAYAGYNQGSRAPSSIELGCADPNNPCKLPNAFAGDPPLKQVVARTWEAGFRGNLPEDAHLSWNAGVFRSTASNDILFVADNAAGFGYFKNFGKTRRQGIELSADGKFDQFSFGGNYTLLDATFRSPETVDGAGNSTNDEALAGRRGLEGTIDITPGNRIPLTPRHTFKFHAEYTPIKDVTVGFETLTSSGVSARGDENNLHQPDGTYYIGEGKTKGYTTLALHGEYQVIPAAQVFIRVDNVLDKKFATSAQLAGTGFDANGNFIARAFPAVGGEFPVRQATFYAPGTPRAIFGGVKINF